MRLRSFLFQNSALFSPDGPGSSGSSATPASGGGASTSPTPSGGGSGSGTPTPSSPASAPGPKGASLDAFRGQTASAGENAPAADGANYDFMHEIFGAAPSAPPSQAEPSAASGQQPAQEPAPVAQPQDPAQQQPRDPSQQQPPASGQQGEVVTQPGQQQQPQGPRYNPADPIGLARALQEPENNAQALEHLANTVFKLSDKDMEDLETNVAGTVPKLLAKAVLHSQVQMLSVLGHIMPLMMQNHGVISQKQNEAEDKFFQAWPSLDRAKHGKLVAELGVRYRQMNPNDTSEQMIERLGPFALMQAGLPMTAMAKPGQPQQPNVNGNGHRAPKQVAFQPASPGAVTHQQVPQDDQFGFLGNRGE